MHIAVANIFYMFKIFLILDIKNPFARMLSGGDKISTTSRYSLYTKYHIVALGLAAAFRPSARASNGLLHTT